MKLTWSPQSEAVRAVHRIKIDGFSTYSCSGQDSDYYVKSTWNVDGYDWEVRLYPCHHKGCSRYVALKLIFHGEAGGIDVTANLSCRLVYPSGALQPSAEKIGAATSFRRPSDSSESLPLLSRDDIYFSGFIQSDGSATVECAVQHLGELLESQVGADVTFALSGESFAGHKNVLAARSPVFMAEFFGGMREKTSGRVKIKEIEPSVFGAMLRFIYTDAVPELDKKMEPTTATLAQHLLVAADRYGLDRLKVMCERWLADGIGVGTAAAMLSPAERHGCSQLKARCVEFIAGESRKNLDAVMETQGFKDLMVNSPSLMAELLVAAHGRKN
ncbi:hypothetical protein C2845_PM05G14010 [Panicum miliaceum]|uniref:BTB domain-containing protein n=1 Tax=Panicum miliaceum TaxID=4540 RepID=A0A3L6SWS5_PANMI|nr:hypothetical protein C2845_PM05G14010 [Panicum miliaceum]